MKEKVSYTASRKGVLIVKIHMNGTRNGTITRTGECKGLTVLLVTPSLTLGLSLMDSRLLPAHLLHSILSTE